MTSLLIDNNGLSVERIRSAIPSVYAPAPHESRSARYGFIPTGDILVGLAEEGIIPTSVMLARTRKEDRKAFTKHLIRLRKSDDLGSHNPDIHEIVMVNSHDGSSAYQLMHGVFRMVCSNGQIHGDIADMLKVRHSGRAMEDVITGTYRIIEESDQVMAGIEEMKGISLTRSEQLLLSEYTMKARFEAEEEENIVEGSIVEAEQALVPYQPIDFLRVRRYADAPSSDGSRDLYTTYNVLQENHLRGGVSRRDLKTGKRHTTREVKSIENNVRLNRLVSRFADEMRKLKQS